MAVFAFSVMGVFDSPFIRPGKYYGSWDIIVDPCDDEVSEMSIYLLVYPDSNPEIYRFRAVCYEHNVCPGRQPFEENYSFSNEGIATETEIKDRVFPQCECCHGKSFSDVFTRVYNNELAFERAMLDPYVSN